MDNINKKDLAKLADVKLADVEAVFSQIATQLGKGNKVSIHSFGSFESRLQKGKSGIVPGTSKTYQTNDKMVPKFSPAKGLKDTTAGI